VVRHGKCVSTIYGTGQVHVSAAGTVKLKIKPTRKTLSSLHKGKRLRVTLTVTFRPSGGGKSATHTKRVTVHGKKK
jgi:VCBS repeat-containing protein